MKIKGKRSINFIDIYALTDGRLNSQFRMNFDQKQLNIRRDIVIPIHLTVPIDCEYFRIILFQSDLSPLINKFDVEIRGR